MRLEVRPIAFDPALDGCLFIQQGANLCITGDALRPKYALQVASSLGLLDQTLIGQKRLRLPEEDLKGVQRRILDFVADILSCVRRGQPLEVPLQFLDPLVKFP
jgi:hypothetical protein